MTHINDIAVYELYLKLQIENEMMQTIKVFTEILRNCCADFATSSQLDSGGNFKFFILENKTLKNIEVASINFGLIGATHLNNKCFEFNENKKRGIQND